MEFVIKNIILYDEFGNVAGFAEFKIRTGRASIKVRYNDYGGVPLVFNVIANGERVGAFGIAGVQSLFEMHVNINAEKEIFVSVGKRENGEVRTLASGVVNENMVEKAQAVDEKVIEKCDELPVIKNNAVTELDQIIRKVCIVGEDGKGQCETCPYREHFFGVVATVDEDEVVV